MGVVVNNCATQGKLQPLVELHKESNPREQSSHSHWNLDRGSRNQVPGGWEFVGDYGADGDEYGEHVGGVVSVEES